MVFSSAVFLFAFLPCVLALYFIVPGRAAKNILLLIASLFFYAWGEPKYVVLMIGSIIINWAFGLAIEVTVKTNYSKVKKLKLLKALRGLSKRILLICAVVASRSCLGFIRGFVSPVLRNSNNRAYFFTAIYQKDYWNRELAESIDYFVGLKYWRRRPVYKPGG